MRKTLDQIMREHPLLQKYLALGGTYHFDSRDIVLCTPGIPEQTHSICYVGGKDAEWYFDFFIKVPIMQHIDYLEEQLQSQAEFERQMREVEQFEQEEDNYRQNNERPWQFLLIDADRLNGFK